MRPPPRTSGWRSHGGPGAKAEGLPAVRWPADLGYCWNPAPSPSVRRRFSPGSGCSSMSTRPSTTTRSAGRSRGADVDNDVLVVVDGPVPSARRGVLMPMSLNFSGEGFYQVLGCVRLGSAPSWRGWSFTLMPSGIRVKDQPPHMSRLKQQFVPPLLPKLRSRRIPFWRETSVRTLHFPSRRGFCRCLAVCTVSSWHGFGNSSAQLRGLLWGGSPEEPRHRYVAVSSGFFISHCPRTSVCSAIRRPPCQSDQPSKCGIFVSRRPNGIERQHIISELKKDNPRSAPRVAPAISATLPLQRHLVLRS